MYVCVCEVYYLGGVRKDLKKKKIHESEKKKSLTIEFKGSEKDLFIQKEILYCVVSHC